MPLVKPQVTPGINSQATQVQAASNYYAGNLLRWRLGYLEKIKGWERLVQAPFQAIIRKMHAWLDLENLKNLLVASDLGVEILISQTNYLLARASTFLPPTKAWFLENLGEKGLVLAQGGPLELYTPPISGGAVTTLVATAPTVSNGMIVAMPQAQVILFGTQPIIGSGGIDPLLVRFSDAGTYDTWTAAVSNQAGSYRLSRGSLIVGAIQSPQMTFLFTDIDVWSMSYVGPPLIYGFTVMGTGCGLIAEDAVGTLGRTTYWMTERGFWQVGDSGVQPLLCTVYDYVFEDIDSVNQQKCFVATNSTTNEIAFFFPSRAVGALLLLGENLLRWSQDFTHVSVWIPTHATVTIVGGFAAKYVYEPQYIARAWFEDSGVQIIAWWDRDVQGMPTSALLAPDGTPTVNQVTEDTANSQHYITQSINKLAERTDYTFSVYAHITSTRNLTLRASTFLGSTYATFNSATGSFLASSTTGTGFTLVSWGVVTDFLATGTPGNGWYRYFIVVTSDDSPTLDLSFNVTNGTTLSYLGTGNYCYLWGAQLNLGNELLDYQATQGTIPENEPTHYAKYNATEQAWDSGVLDRTAWIDSSVWGPPLGADTNMLVQQHERGFDADGQPMRGVFAETGYAEVGDGTQLMLIDQCAPDFKWAGHDGAVNVFIRAKNYAGGPEQLVGPYSMTPDTQFFSMRIRARYLAVRYEWEERLGFSARVGAVTFRVKPAGRRP